MFVTISGIHFHYCQFSVSSCQKFSIFFFTLFLWIFIVFVVFQICSEKEKCLLFYYYVYSKKFILTVIKMISLVVILHKWVILRNSLLFFHIQMPLDESTNKMNMEYFSFNENEFQHIISAKIASIILSYYLNKKRLRSFWIRDNLLFFSKFYFSFLIYSKKSFNTFPVYCALIFLFDFFVDF